MIKSQAAEQNHVIFENRYKIIQKLAKGSFGHIYVGVDLNQEHGDIICKINDDKNMNDLEATILSKLNQKGFKNFP